MAVRENLGRRQKSRPFAKISAVCKNLGRRQNFRPTAKILADGENLGRELSHEVAAVRQQRAVVAAELGHAAAALAVEVGRAMDLHVHLLLCHEMVGGGGQDARGGVEFSAFFSCAEGATPQELLQQGIYSEIAVPLKGGPWREPSLALLAFPASARSPFPRRHRRSYCT